MPLHNLSTLRVSDGFLLFTAGVAIGCLLMVRRERPPCPDHLAVRPVPESEREGVESKVVGVFNGEALKRTG
jgi:hypothetical protein